MKRHCLSAAIAAAFALNAPQAPAATTAPTPQITLAKATPARAFVRGRLNVKTTVANIDTANTSPATLVFRYSRDNVIDANDPAFSTATPVPAIRAGRKITLNTALRAPDQPATYWIGACIDTACAVAGKFKVTPALLIKNGFDTGGELWTVVSFKDLQNADLSVIGTYSATYYAAGGNPGGYISSNDPDGGDFTFSAPASYLGDHSELVGGTLFYDTNHLGAPNYQAIDIVLMGGGETLLWQSAPPLLPNSAWSTVAVPLYPTPQWHVGTPGGPLAGDGDFQAVLANITGLYIRGEYTLGSETAGLDNVTLKPAQTFRDPMPNAGQGPLMVDIPAGNFQMGSATIPLGGYFSTTPVHTVTLAKAFAVGAYEVTFAEFDAFCDATGNPKPDDYGFGRGNRPAINVTWDEATAYAQWLSTQTGHTYRLPSEAEWEYVARAKSSTNYWWGDAVGTNNADCSGCGSAWDGNQTAPVGSFPANPFGVYDTVGNVVEWTLDCPPAPDYVGAPADGKTWTSAAQCAGNDYRVVRGGDWFSPASFAKSAFRMSQVTWARNGNLGFRLVRTQ